MTWALLVGGCFVAFLIMEFYALSHGRKTLSRAVVDFSKVWTLFPFACGLAAGALAAHFWWPICP